MSIQVYKEEITKPICDPGADHVGDHVGGIKIAEWDEIFLHEFHSDPIYIGQDKYIEKLPQELSRRNIGPVAEVEVPKRYKSSEKADMNNFIELGNGEMGFAGQHVTGHGQKNPDYQGPNDRNPDPAQVFLQKLNHIGGEGSCQKKNCKML
jgi:hypothetical protein